VASLMFEVLSGLRMIKLFL